MKKYFLLIGPKNYLFEKGKFNTEYGIVDLRKAKVGNRIKSSAGKIFYVTEPSILDMMHKASRGPQVVLPKDAGAIIAATGCSPGWRVVDAGAGSGFLSMFLANLGCKVYSYENRKQFYEVAKKNVSKFGKDVTIYHKDISKGIKEKNADLITLDLENPERVLKHASKTLRIGGWVVVYSMHVEQVKKVIKELKKYNFSDPGIIENVWISWQSKGEATRPRTHLGHTGFLTFARKVGP